MVELSDPPSIYAEVVWFLQTHNSANVRTEVKLRNPQLLLLGSDLAAPTETSPFGLQLTHCILQVAIHPISNHRETLTPSCPPNEGKDCRYVQGWIQTGPPA